MQNYCIFSSLVNDREVNVMNISSIRQIFIDYKFIILSVIILPILYSILIISHPIAAVSLAALSFLLILLRNHLYEFALVSLVLTTTNIRWLLPLSFPIYYINFLLLPLLLFQIKMRQGAIIKDNIDRIILLFLVVTALSMVKTIVFDGQPFISALKAWKINVLIMYFYVFRYSTRINTSKVVKILIISGIGVAALTAFVSLTQNVTLIELANMNPDYRLGFFRFFRFVICIPLVAFTSIYFYLAFLRKRDIWSFSIFTILIFVVNLFMQTRSLLLGLVVALSIFTIKGLKNFSYSITLIICFLLGIILFYLVFAENTGLDSYINLTKNEYQSINIKMNSFSSRLNSHRYFFEGLMAHPLVGRGTFWPDFPECYETKRLGRNVYDTDVGIANITYKYGMVGLLWFLATIYLVFRNDLSLAGKAPMERSALSCLFLFMLISGITLDFITDEKNQIFTFMMIGIYKRSHHIDASFLKTATTNDIRNHYH